jgi:cytochrome c556
MHDPRTDRQTEMAMITRAVERMAKRLKGRSVIDEEKMREFFAFHPDQRIEAAPKAVAEVG